MSGLRPRAVFFDAGNTLVRINYAVIAARLAMHGIVVSAEQIRRAEWQARVRLDATLAGGGSTETRGTADRYLAFVLEGVGVTDAATVSALAEWRRSFNGPVGIWDLAEPRAEEALALVRAAGLTAAVISNSNGSIRGILERLGLARHLDFVLDSFEEGVEKPDPRFFRIALERARVEPAQAVYIGDLYSIDVLGARAAGMGAILLDPGACWGERDCPRAPDVLDAVRLIV